MAQVNVGYTTDEYATVSDPTPPYPQTFQYPNPPNYNDIIKMPAGVHAAYIPPPQYEGPRMPNQVVVISAPIPQNPQSGELKLKNLHLIIGTVLTVLGGIQMILDPLLPALFQYPYSLFPGGLFTLISGLCSIHGSRKDNKCSLRASLTFNILALLNISTSIIVALVVVNSGDSLIPCTNSIFLCVPSLEFYSSGFKGFSIFNLVYGTALFFLLCYDSGIKCRDICCCKRQQRRGVYNQNSPN